MSQLVLYTVPRHPHPPKMAMTYEQYIAERMMVDRFPDQDHIEKEWLTEHYSHGQMEGLLRPTGQEHQMEQVNGTTYFYPFPSIEEEPEEHVPVVSIDALLLTDLQLLENGFPREETGGTVHIRPNEYQQDRHMFYPPGDCSRRCTRCKTEFQVDSLGYQRTDRREIVCGDSFGTYPYHVHDQMPVEKLKMFQRAVEVNRRIPEGRILSIDCEMVFTTRGQALARVTVLDQSGAVVVDVVVQPEDAVMDCVTRFSGLTMDDFKWATASWETARAAVLGEMNASSILVGHGLNGDLKALGIVHERVIDTSVIFRTPSGKRPALRHLTSEYLGYRIQNDDVKGHCSREDALATIRLVEFACANFI